MVENVLMVVDGSAPSGDAARLAISLLPKAAEVLAIQVVPQIPYAWTAWPAFPDASEDLAKAWEYVSGVAHELEVRGWKVNTRVHFSPSSMAEMDKEILRFAEMLRYDLIFLALENGSVRANVVREATVPVLVAKVSSPHGEAAGRRSRTESLEPAMANRPLLLNPVGALVFRLAGIL